MEATEPGGGKLAVENLWSFTGRERQIAVQPLEIADNLLLANDCSDSVNFLGVALGGKTCPVQPRCFGIAVVAGVAQVGVHPLRLAAGDWAVIEQDD